MNKVFPSVRLVTIDSWLTRENQHGRKKFELNSSSVSQFAIKTQRKNLLQHRQVY